MGYSTDFEGRLEIFPALNPDQVDYLRKFSRSRRMHRTKGPYYIGGGNFGQGREDDIIDYNASHSNGYGARTKLYEAPSLWCDFWPTEDGTAIVWNGKEKTYEATEWISFLIQNFLSGACLVEKYRDIRPDWDFSQVPDFTKPHDVNGILNAFGEESGDIWRIVVESNRVRREQAEFRFV